MQLLVAFGEHCDDVGFMVNRGREALSATCGERLLPSPDFCRYLLNVRLAW
jgi:hypothetical protein